MQFHEEDYRLKEWNKPELVEIFVELEFKSLGKRILGDEFNVFTATATVIQTDLFGNEVPGKLIEVKAN